MGDSTGEATKSLGAIGREANAAAVNSIARGSNSQACQREIRDVVLIFPSSLPNRLTAVNGRRRKKGLEERWNTELACGQIELIEYGARQGDAVAVAGLVCPRRPLARHQYLRGAGLARQVFQRLREPVHLGGE